MYTALAYIVALALFIAQNEFPLFPPKPAPAPPPASSSEVLPVAPPEPPMAAPVAADYTDPGYAFAVRMLYLAPIDSGDSEHWYYSWNGLSEIRADDWLHLCNHNNYLGLPRGWEGDYLSADTPEGIPVSEQNHYLQGLVDGDKLEAVMKKRFGLEAEYLRTSWYYHAENHTYTIGGTGDGSLPTVPIRVVQSNNIVTIEVGHAESIGLGADRMREWNAVSLPGYAGRMIVPLGTLKLEITRDISGFGVKYLSYQVTAAESYLAERAFQRNFPPKE